MKDYQRAKNNKYILPRAVYNQTLWRIRDYYRLKETVEDLITSSASMDGMPRGGELSDVTAKAAIRRENYLRDVKVIETEIAAIPNEYQKGVWGSIMFGEQYPNDADRSTYGRYKSKFIFSVADRFGIL